MEPCAVRGGSRLGEQLGKEFLDVQRPKAIFLCYLFKSRTFKQMQNKKKKGENKQKKANKKIKAVCALVSLPDGSGVKLGGGAGASFFWGGGGGRNGKGRKEAQAERGARLGWKCACALARPWTPFPSTPCGAPT